MGKYTLVVLTKPTEGNDAEFNRWYTEDHLKDVLNTPGFTAAQRFKFVTKGETSASYPYLALYEVETSNPEAALEDLLSRWGTEKMPSSPAIDMNDLYCVLYEEMTGRIIRDTRR
jgi:hypothetical protein